MTAAHDLLVLSVERRLDETLSAESEAVAAASEAASSSETSEEAAAHTAAAAAAAEDGVEGLPPSAAERPREQRLRGRQRPPEVELEWDPLPDPVEAQL